MHDQCQMGSEIHTSNDNKQCLFKITATNKQAIRGERNKKRKSAEMYI